MISNIFSALGSWLIHADENVLLFINGMHSQFFDEVMWLVSGKLTWVPLYLLLTYFIFRKFGLRNGLVIMLFIAITIAAVDQTCSSLIRPLAGRMRPSNPDNPLSQYVHIVNGYNGGRYGFPSCHAANASALVVYISLLFRRRWVTVGMTTWMLLMIYSRMYLGVHYPGDLICGAAVGGFWALNFYGMMLFYKRMRERLPFRRYLL